MKYIKIWTNFRDTISRLDDDGKGRLLDAMLLYAETGCEPENLSGNEAYLWPAVRQDIDRLREASEYCRDQRRERKESKEKEPKEKKEKVKEIYKENEKEKGETKALPRFSPPSPEEVRQYCLEQGLLIDPQQFYDFYTSNGWMVGNQPMKDWRACIRAWNARERIHSRENPRRDYSQRDNTGAREEALERMRKMIRESIESGAAAEKPPEKETA